MDKKLTTTFTFEGSIVEEQDKMLLIQKTIRQLEGLGGKGRLTITITPADSSFDEQTKAKNLLDAAVKNFEALGEAIDIVCNFKNMQVVSSKFMGAIGMASARDIVRHIYIWYVQKEIKNAVDRFMPEKITTIDLSREDNGGVRVVEEFD
ncbi:MAG: hypothetical protein SFH39_08610 [Candidatus Magnetobacterium sp. LHC-1]|uniref:Uncharacterized protein n=1 Tax=Candidatus Magnetobacterium casense TaxID=1455061 RepID=A0ABS6S1D0_9BACT|nr:hypothetical protein [Candidatus Magnetobacterium casensis]MBF0606256.1 hypothetical protein [Nitrospirota bacterium]MBV6342657.1 hypothetical protein [Candidatus Magnetobacterium casensis]